MTSLRELGVHNHHFQHHPHNKITKVPRGGNMVKPILKKLASSPKNSLDLDRGWEEQPVDFGGYGGNSSTNDLGRPSRSRSVRDVSFKYPSPWEPSGGVGIGIGISGAGAGLGAGSGAAATSSAVHVGAGGLEPTSPLLGGINGVTTSSSARGLGRPGGRYNHVRSASGASHVSIATNGSCHRPGASFVHPFQQTPRTNTPPLIYAHSFTSFEREHSTLPAREYSPTIITENDDDDAGDFLGSANPSSSPLLLSHSAASAGSHHLHHKALSNSHSHSQSATNLRRPSIASQRTSSMSDIHGHHHSSSLGANTTTTNSHPPSLRLNTSTSATTTTTSNPTNTNPPIIPRSVPSASSKLSHVPLSTSISHSNSDLTLTTTPSDSPRPSLHLSSPGTSTTTTATTMSPLRTSIEGAFRLRSRSEVDTGVSRIDIREARRQFEEDERIKTEKYEAEQRRKQERKLEKERVLLLRKNTGASSSGAEMTMIGSRPSFSRKRSPPMSLVGARRTRSGESAAAAMSEKTAPQGGQPAAAAAFMSSNYESTEDGTAPEFGPDVNDVRFGTPQRAHTTKRKTQSYWTSFVLWFRTRLLRLNRH